LDVSSLLDKLFPGGQGGGSEGPPWIVLGLGNPGAEYRNTRHNVGWWCMDELVRRTKADLNRKRTNRYKSGPEKILVVTDDINLSPGSVRIRKKGGPGGHNGLKSVITALGTNEFPRVRIGVGNPETSTEQVDHVLGTFDPETRERVTAASVRAADAITMIVNGEIDNAMNKYNNNGEEPKAK
jgi:PTH1 family peptidyl-tRNA hydrolase